MCSGSGATCDDRRGCAAALRGAVAALVLLIVSVEFNQHRVVDVRTESGFNPALTFKWTAIRKVVSDGFTVVKGETMKARLIGLMALALGLFATTATAATKLTASGCCPCPFCK
jgi:hypothetical protein